ncbi:hypothetical protein [Halovivax cerinus]|uniref:Acyl-CoA synthetase (AMP-forming)/AMP-acid ligase II n=1 Tax=Halovivax cerinus TaxID=1487865 RepID=A0ABD5NPK4_9EURY|nr:hypothetical protein [Halovivax cerinus]
METVADFLTRDRRSGRPALVDATGRTYDTHWVCTSAWKAGNFLRHTGVRGGVTVGVVGDGPLALLSFFGTALLSGRTWFEPPSSLDGYPEVRTLVAPADRVDAYDADAPIQRVCYGGDPPAPEIHHLDAGLWSENPSFPPTDIGSETPLLVDATVSGDKDADPGAPAASISHGEAIAQARSIAAEFDVGPGTRVVVGPTAFARAGPFADPRVVVAGVLAPLVADGVTVLSPMEATPGEPTADDLVLGPNESEPISGRRLPLSAVELDGS